jgi:hypothetical protein
VQYLDDYREVSPGLWFPMSQGFGRRSVDGEEPKASGGRDLRVVEIKVNQPLPDALFTIEIPEGAAVTDRRYEDSARP